jgi:hypothetical protein
MKPEHLSAAMRQWRTAVLIGGQLPWATIVDNHVLTLETMLLLAAENMDKAARYDALVAELREAAPDIASVLIARACAK